MTHEDDRPHDDLQKMLQGVEQEPHELVQFTFVCPRGLPDRVKILCIERNINPHEFAVAALASMLGRYEQKRDSK